MPSLSQGGRHRNAQALPLPRMVRSQTESSRCFQKVGANSENRKEGVEMAKRHCNAPIQGKQMEQGSFQHDKVGVREG